MSKVYIPLIIEYLFPTTTSKTFILIEELHIPYTTQPLNF